MLTFPMECYLPLLYRRGLRIVRAGNLPKRRTRCLINRDLRGPATCFRTNLDLATFCPRVLASKALSEPVVVDTPLGSFAKARRNCRTLVVKTIDQSVPTFIAPVR